MEGVSQLERDIDVMRDVYMLPSQQDAYARILQAALSARAQGEGEPVAWLCEAEARVPPAFVRSEEVARETYERVGYNITPLYTAAPKQQAVGGRDDAVRKAAHALIDLIASFDDRDLLALDNDKHPPSSLSALAADLREALAALPGKTEVE